MIIRGSETITIKRLVDSGTVDKYNEPIYTTTNITVKNCLIAFDSTDEKDEVARNPEDTKLTIYMPKGTTIEDNDVFNIRSTDFVKNGMANDWISPFPLSTGVVVFVRKRHG